MDVLGPANGQGGPVSFSHGVRSGVSTVSIRKKLRKATPQLPSDSPGVIVATGARLEIDELLFQHGLYGDVSWLFTIDHGSHAMRPAGLRSRINGFFHSNRKVSAVCFAEVQLDVTGASLLTRPYHNPIARNPVGRDVFRLLAAEQFDVVSRDRAGYNMGWIR